MPSLLQMEKNIKFIKNFGNPSRAFCLGTKIADGKFIAILADDAHLIPDSIDKCVELLLLNNPDKDIICMKYCEGEHYNGKEPPIDFWSAGFHEDTRQPGIDKNWKLSLTPLMSLRYYNELGGIDCLFEHVNFNMIDLGFRAIRNGSKVLLSPTLVMNCDFEPDRNAENSCVMSAYYNNDRELFHKMYASNNRPIKIEENWIESDPVWKRRNHEWKISMQ